MRRSLRRVHPIIFRTGDVDTQSFAIHDGVEAHPLWRVVFHWVLVIRMGLGKYLRQFQAAFETQRRPVL